MHSEDEWHSGNESEEGSGGRGRAVEDPEVWMDYYSEELVTLWHLLRDQTQAMGVSILDRCTIGDFTQFCFRHSSGHPPPC
jgi:hypothetical protein